MPRTRVASLTPPGAEVLDEYRAQMHRAVREWLQGFSDEDRERFVALSSEAVDLLARRS